MSLDTFCENIEKNSLKFWNRFKNVVSGLDSWYTKSSLFQGLFFIIGLSITFLFIYILNSKAPMIADDYSYTFVFGTEEQVKNVRDIVISQYNHYFQWGGRSIVHFFAQLFLLLGKSISNVINSIGYVLFIVLIYFHSNGVKKFRVSLLVIINLLVWFFLPAYGQTIIWITGSANYMWGCIFILSCLLPFRLFLEKENIIKDNLFNAVLLLIMGIIAGWTNENTAGAMIVVTLLYFSFCRFNKIKIPKWFLSGLIGEFIGFSLMILAPGNSIRSADPAFKNDNPFVKILIDRITNITHDFYRYMFVLVLLLIILLILNNYFSKDSRVKTNFLSSFYVVASISAAYAMIIAPCFPPRAWFGSIVYMIISIGVLYSNLNFEIKPIKLISLVCLCFALLSFYPKYKYAYVEAVRVDKLYEERISYINQQKTMGQMDLTVEPIYTNSEHNALNGLSDINENPDYWINVTVAKYFKIDSIKGENNVNKK